MCFLCVALAYSCNLQDLTSCTLSWVPLIHKITEDEGKQDRNMTETKGSTQSFLPQNLQPQALCGWQAGSLSLAVGAGREGG